MNIYGYVGNSPLVFIDPYGLAAWEDIANIANGIGTAVTEGAKGAFYSANQASADIYYLSQEGDPYAKSALLLAQYSIIAPLNYISGGYVGLGIKCVNSAARTSKRNLPFNDTARTNGVNKTLDKIGSNGPFPYKQDGTVFKNREGKLPPGNYKEYTIDTPGSSNRGKRRVVVDQNT